MLDDRPGVSFCSSQPLIISLQTEKLLSMRREQRAVKFYLKNICIMVPPARNPFGISL